MWAKNSTPDQAIKVTIIRSLLISSLYHFSTKILYLVNEVAGWDLLERVQRDKALEASKKAD